MSDLFTKATTVKTATKLWVIGIALVIMVNIPYDDRRYQPSPVATPATRLSFVAPLPNPTASESRTHPVDALPVTPKPSAPLLLLPSASGEYTGSVHNETAGISAEVAIRLRDSDGTLSGSMTVKPPLYGSGPLAGAASGAHVAFTVTSQIGKIAFTGTRSKQNISGKYTVEQSSGGVETGTFTLDRIPHSMQAPTAAAKGEVATSAATLPDVELPHPEPAPLATPPPPKIIEKSNPKNYSNCMSGYAYSCNKALLTPEEADNVKASDLRRNYSSCMSGFAYACNKHLLTPDELSQVQASDLRRNYSSCMSGFAYACNKALLTPEEAANVTASDLRRNYSSCMSGFAYACNKHLLTPEELSQVQASDLRRNYSNCLSGFAYACNRHLLTSDQLSEVENREQSRRK